MKNVLKRTLAVLLFLAPPTLLAASWEEQHAFCHDRATPMLKVSNYEYQKSYNECKENADSLIAEYEKQKMEFAEEIRLSQAEYQKRMAENAKIERQRMVEMEAERKREFEKREQEKNKVDDLFGEF